MKKKTDVSGRTTEIGCPNVKAMAPEISVNNNALPPMRKTIIEAILF